MKVNILEDYIWDVGDDIATKGVLIRISTRKYTRFIQCIHNSKILDFKYYKLTNTRYLKKGSKWEKELI